MNQAQSQQGEQQREWDSAQSRHPSVRQSAVEYARGIGGGLVIGLPLLMTMEMWWSGFTMPPHRMLLFFVLNYGVLLILEYYSGFREENTFLDEAIDAVVALGMGLAVSAIVLMTLNILQPGMSLQELLGKIILESIPVSIGVSVAMGQLGQQTQEGERKRREAGFWGTQAIALAGAMVFGFNIAPTEEPLLLGLRMSWVHSLGLLLLSLILVHAIVYAVDFRGTHALPEGAPVWRSFLEVSVTSYAIALALAGYLLWTFGRVGPDIGLSETLSMIVALGLATSLGAGVAKLIL